MVSRPVFYILIGVIIISCSGAVFYIFRVKGVSLPSLDKQGSTNESVLPQSARISEGNGIPAIITEPELDIPSSSSSESPPVFAGEPESLPEEENAVPPSSAPVLAPAPVPAPVSAPVTPTPVSQEENQDTSVVHLVSIKDNSFEPRIVTITVGDTVIWINDDTQLHWPASDPHPTHTGLPDFDPLADLSPGETFSFTFRQVGNFVYHDHTQAVVDDKATITGGVRVLPKQ